MRPIQIKMQGFGSYAEETVVDFDGVRSDLFLITGDTGSGKTTIFDAVSFALYGETSSSSKEADNTELRSQYGDSRKAFVEFTFAEGSGDTEQIYTVRREPASRSKTGSTTYSQKALLQDPSGIAYDKAKEVNDRIFEIVGLTKKQFAQIAMLAQGEFMALLTATADEKKEIFRRLFGTQKFEDLQNKLKKRANELKSQAEQAWQRIVDQTQQIRIPDTFESVIALRDLVEALSTSATSNMPWAENVLSMLECLINYQTVQSSEAEAMREKSDAAYEAAAQQETAAKALAEAFTEAENSRRELEALLSRQSEMEEKKKLLADLKKAATIDAVYQTYRKSHSLLEEQTQELLKCQQELPGLEKAAEEARCRAQKASSEAETQQRFYGEKKQIVDTAIGLFHRAAEIQKNLAVFAAEERKSRNTHQKRQQEATAMEAEMMAIRERTTALGSVEAVLAEERGSQEKIEVAIKSYNDWCRQGKEKQQAQARYQATDHEWNSAERIYTDHERAFRDDAAGILAKDLTEGQPCPVCGSLEHPHPHMQTDTSVLSREALDAEKEQVKALKKKCDDALAKASLANGKWQEQDEHWQSVLASMRELAQKRNPQIAEEDPRALLKALRTVVANQIHDLEAEQRKLTDLNGQFDDMTKKLPKLREQAAAAQARWVQAAQKIESEKAKLAQLNQQLMFSSEQEALAELKKAENARDAANKVRAAADTDLQRCQQATTTTRSRIESLETTIPKREREEAAAEAAYQNVMAERSMDEQTWQPLASKSQQAAAPALERETADFEQNLNTQQAMAKKAAARIEGKERPDLEAASHAVHAAKKAREQAITASRDLAVDLQHNRGCQTQLESAIAERKGPASDYERVQTLYKRMAGQTTNARIDIETFVQRRYLEDILDAANRRFREMTGGQYELRLIDLEKGGQGKNRGLDLLVHSSVTDKSRNIGTLSGGESFMAALALSLGMADVIEQRSAAVQLDMMFIDEGFGSLDDNARREAVKILQRLAGGSKLIGIISHVSELKNEIDEQLIVTKDENGSHVHWQHA